MKLSILMPCYNVEKTLQRALDSILMQKTNFEYEIIIINDASEDNTLTIANKYAWIFKNIVVISNEKNEGNAYSYYKGLCAAKGDYFCVLDGDDYYTINDKLQRQIDFLDNDKNEEYVGTATNFIIDLGNDLISIPDRSRIKEFSYADFISSNSGYYHTATYVYRNIFRGNVPKIFADKLYRGDTPRTMFHLKYSGKKIKVLDFVGSAYTFEFNGIWSSMTQKQQFQFQIDYYNQHKERVNTDIEKASCDKLIEHNRKMLQTASDNYRRYPEMTIDEAINRIRKYANTFAFKQRDYVFNKFYYSEYVDTLCASLSYIFTVHHPIYKLTTKKENNLCIIIGLLNPHGGGIFSEIKELIDIYKEKEIYLILTGECSNEILKKQLDDGIEILQKYPNLNIVLPPQNVKTKYSWLREKVTEISPYRCYYYCSHNDVYGATLPQSGTENIVLFSFDHGYSCGISNPLHNNIIAKRKVDYILLKKKFKDKVIFIPTWENMPKDCESYKYIPFYEHTKLITASGAARSYKIEGIEPYKYLDYIVELLNNTGGIHYHFGPLSNEFIDELDKKLELKGISKDHFINITWSDNIPLDLLRKHVDVFIEPFPVVSYKLTLLVESVGIPVISKKGHTRINIVDFVPENSMFWKDQEEFIKILSSLDEGALQEYSSKSLKYFLENHSIDIVKKLLLQNVGLDVTENINYVDNIAIDIMQVSNIFGNNYNIKLTTDLNEDLKRLRNNNHLKNNVIANTSANDKLLINSLKEKETSYKKLLDVRSNKWFGIIFVVSYPIKIIKHINKFSKFKEKRMFYRFVSMRKDDPRKELDIIKKSKVYKIAKFFDKSL